MCKGGHVKTFSLNPRKWPRTSDVESYKLVDTEELRDINLKNFHKIVRNCAPIIVTYYTGTVYVSVLSSQVSCTRRARRLGQVPIYTSARQKPSIRGRLPLGVTATVTVRWDETTGDDVTDRGPIPFCRRRAPLPGRKLASSSTSSHRALRLKRQTPSKNNLFRRSHSDTQQVIKIHAHIADHSQQMPQRVPGFRRLFESLCENGTTPWGEKTPKARLTPA